MNCLAAVALRCHVGCRAEGRDFHIKALLGEEGFSSAV
jgi:hypothetical protein